MILLICYGEVVLQSEKETGVDLEAVKTVYVFLHLFFFFPKFIAIGLEWSPTPLEEELEGILISGRMKSPNLFLTFFNFSNSLHSHFSDN